MNPHTPGPPGAAPRRGCNELDAVGRIKLFEVPGPGLSCLAAPVFEAGGKVAGALATSIRWSCSRSGTGSSGTPYATAQLASHI
ncbi:hypothetical protein [Streptomyces azureus]|uniref:Transcriptional regulator, IclR family n=1 Tax=Streptomyces azureus TaxID=146537 RepID=A0A0K8PHY8_STRAJ|nr:hypothetical protein [Streptomyces azureus]GAP47510.1 transcriptional regulator, IclR family [Streptomyces azureus]